MLFDHTHTHRERWKKKKKTYKFLFSYFCELGHLILFLSTKHFPVAGFVSARRDKPKKWKLKIKFREEFKCPPAIGTVFFYTSIYIYRIMYYYYFKNRKWKGGNWVRQKKTEMLDIFYSEGYSERTAVIIICRYILVYTLWIIWGIVDRSWTSILPPVIPREKNKKQMRNFLFI